MGRPSNGRRPAAPLAPLALLLLLLTGCARPEYQAMGPAVAPPSLADRTFVTLDGVALPLRSWAPPAGERPRRVLLALHGINDYGNFFALPAPYLASHGTLVYAYDQRGFGAAPRPGIWAGATTYAADAKAAVAALRARHPGLPVILLGESMGGAIAILAATETDPAPLDGLVLVSPAVWSEDTMPFYQRWVLWFVLRVAPTTSFTGQGLQRFPSDNLPMLRAFSRDPLVLKATRVDAIAGLVALMTRAAARAGDVPRPALVLLGANEDIVDRAALRAFTARLPAGVTIAAYPEGWHMLLRDRAGPIVWQDLAAWLEDPSAPLPSGADRADIDDLLADRDVPPPDWARPPAGQ